MYAIMADLNRIKVVLEIDVRELINKSKEYKNNMAMKINSPYTAAITGGGFLLN